VGAGTELYNSLISSFTNNSPSSSVSVDTTFKADPLYYGAGISTSTQVFNIRYTYTRTGVSASKTHTLTVFPTSKRVQLCDTNTSSLIVLSSPVSNTSYTVGNAAVTITPPTISVTAPTDATYGNTSLPKCDVYLLLQYSTDGGTTWNTFPTFAGGALFTSDQNDASCIQ